MDGRWYSHENSCTTSARYHSGKNDGNIGGNTTGGTHWEHLVDIRTSNITDKMRHSNDLTSVCAWVEELQSLPHDPILLFKPQGEPPPQEMLEMMTSYLQYKPNFNVICCAHTRTCIYVCLHGCYILTTT